MLALDMSWSWLGVMDFEVLLRIVVVVKVVGEFFEQLPLVVAFLGMTDKLLKARMVLLLNRIKR